MPRRPGACNATGCTPPQAAQLDNIYNYPGDKAVQNARPYPNYSQILVPQHNTYANYNGIPDRGASNSSAHLNFNVNYSFSKALGILGSSADFNYTAGIDPFHLGNNYGPLNFDRTQVLNLSYSYQVGKITDQRLLGGFINHWLISGITNVQSGPDMQTGVSFSPGYYVQGNIGSGRQRRIRSVATTSSAHRTSTCSRCSSAIRATGLRGASVPQPHLLRAARHRNQRPVHRAVRSRPGVLQHRPRAGEGLWPRRTSVSIRLRYAAFNFLNHPLNSFGTGYASQTTLQLSDTSANASPTTATYNPATGFGSAPQKLGRRLSEISLKYDF